MKTFAKWTLITTLLVVGLLTYIAFSPAPVIIKMPNGGTMKHIKDGDVTIDTKIYSPNGTLIKHSWTAYDGTPHSRDYDESGEMIREE